MNSGEYVPARDCKTIVANIPIVSVDLVVRHDGGVVLGKRQNEPAKGEWFVPGGRVHKNERLDETVHRIARTELGSDVTIDRRFGVYEHLYDTSEVADVGSKQRVFFFNSATNPPHRKCAPRLRRLV
jgi:colanic acid biosynthesis protein WcaH